MTGPIKLAVLLGSNREGRMSPRVARWFVEQAEARGDVKVDVLDVAELKLPEALDGRAPAVAAARPRFADADAFVVVTPEYNHSFPAPLKSAIDSFHQEWQAKPVGFVSYGGMSGGLRAVEQLRQIFAELHMVSVRDNVSFHNVWGHVGEDGSFPTSPDGCNQAAKTMLDQLVWWADALREAKRRTPYGS
ncbi:NADPH-dependent FMN reductase [Actinocorallia populi]|uniref:NADPH-dependent FMN reductase n=1 Tax=Actinocorallia populi TaxID=2079200 RepID=UPI000D092D75|nr:NAD(P)H-dependent oxidoreductase [Actinocorallia populi]